MAKQLALPFPPPPSVTDARIVRLAIAVGRQGVTLLDKRKTPRGYRDHVLTDHEVELVRRVHEMGGLSLSQIAEKFEVSKQHIHDIVTFRRRSYAQGDD